MNDLLEKQLQHQDDVVKQVSDTIDSLVMSVDSRVLTAVLLMKAAGLLRLLHASGMWNSDDVQALVNETFKDVFEPMDKKPTIMTVNADAVPIRAS